MRIRITVNGIVQGVGFRPFLHRLAEKYHTGGWVRNTSDGLEGVLDGEQDELEQFLAELKTSPPPMAQIESVHTAQIETDADGPEESRGTAAGSSGTFVIRESRIRPGATLISPDISMCPECEAELNTPSDRRYRYPFINCTNCGPRYTIIEELPYDRERTVMDEFPMCPDCAEEYSDIKSRRYHAQPDCCPKCGPQVFYQASEPMRELPAAPGQDHNIPGTAAGDKAFRRAQELLADGGILAVKGIGGIHLACDALNAGAVGRLRRRKHRGEKPLAVMCRSLEAVHRICRITPAEEKLLTSPERPIVLLAKRKDLTDLQAVRALDALSFSARLGVMLPYTPLHTLLLDGIYGGPDILVMTSGNIPGCPVLTDNKSALSALSDVTDGFLLHNRRIANRCDDSLVAEWKGHPYFLRRSRGYVPRPLEFKAPSDTACGKIVPEHENPSVTADGIFALGAEQKASFALGQDRHVFLSPYIGDLKNAETFEHYTQAMRTYERLFRLKPSVYVCDLHPDYLSTGEARLRAASDHVPLLQVQHHWAHMASCMADNNLDRPCFGIIWDGTGLGTDGNIWGGEFLTGDYSSFHRVGSVRPVLLPGGDRAVREIGRIALSLVLDAAKDAENISEFTYSKVPLPEEKCRMLTGLIKSSPRTVPAASSIGRLFDGVCALILGHSEVDYEGEGAALTEALSPAETPEQLTAAAFPSGSALAENLTYSGTAALLTELSYPVQFYEENGMRIFDTRPVTRALLEDLEEHKDKGRSALRFMATLVCMAADQCRVLNAERLPVVLSGGVFQNRFLLHGITSLLEENGFAVYTHRRVSANDEGIALGQLAIACRRRKISEEDETVQASDYYIYQKRGS